MLKHSPLKKMISAVLGLVLFLAAGCYAPRGASVRASFYGEYPYRRPLPYYYYNPYYDPFYFPSYIHDPYFHYFSIRYAFAYPYGPYAFHPNRRRFFPVSRPRLLRPGDRSLRGFRGRTVVRPNAPLTNPSPTVQPEERNLRTMEKGSGDRSSEEPKRDRRLR